MYDVIIIGGGAAGLSAAIVAAKNRSKTLLLDKGGAIITDFPGFPDNPPNHEIIARIKKQAEQLGTEIKGVAVTSCSIHENTKRVVTNEPITYETKTIICATGNSTQLSQHPYPGETELIGRGVGHDVESLAPSTKNAQIAIIGKSVATAEAALYLSQFAEKIYWIIPASKLDLSDKLRNELNNNTKIEPLFSSSLKKINGTTEVSSVTVLYGGQEQELSVKYVIIPNQQYKPITDYLGGTGVQLSPDGCVMVNEKMQTSVAEIFAAGNILCTRPQLSIVCAAQGAIAALGFTR